MPAVIFCDEEKMGFEDQMQHAGGMLQTSAHTGLSFIFAKQKCKQIPSSPLLVITKKSCHSEQREESFEEVLKIDSSLERSFRMTRFFII